MDPLWEQRKRGSVVQQLLKVARRLDEVAVSRVRARHGAEGLRTAHTRLFPHLDLQGTRLTVLAQRLGVSKQAAGQLVDELEAMGILERVPDPDDGRAKRIRFVGGTEALAEGLAVLEGLRADLEAVLGAEAVGRLHRDLDALEAALDDGRIGLAEG